VEDGPAGIDVQAVTAWFAEHVPAARPPLRFERIAGGRSNLTYRVTDADGAAWALRRPPLHSVLASAHDVGREARIMAALAPTDVPVPTVAGHCEEESVNGAPFFVMDFVDGLVLRNDAEAQALSVAARRHSAEALVGGLVAIHAVDPDAVGLGQLGRKEGYIERQLRRWHGQWEQSKTRELPLVDEVHARLSETVPEQGAATIVHGDYRLDNTIVSEAGDLRAVLDWELCTLGDPLADVGQLAVYWSRPYGQGATGAEGFPAIGEVTALYAERSGRDLSQLGYYVAFASWRIAVILEGVYARTRAGAYGESEDDDAMPRAIEGLVERAAEALP
jgi:aminoglycoside phosphotransferase (APT) family kinase protein